MYMKFTLISQIPQFTEKECGYIGARLHDLKKAHTVLEAEAFSNDSVKLFLQAAANFALLRADCLV